MSHFERIETAVTGLAALFAVLRPSDLFGCSTFSKGVTSLHKIMESKKVAVAKDVEHVLANCRDRGSVTAFYDAVVAGVDKLHAAKSYLASKGTTNVRWEHVIITDGEDNDSAHSFEDAMAKVARPGLGHYTCVVIGVGLSDGAAAKLEQLCTPAHCHFYREADTAALSRRMEELSESYKVQLQATTADGRTTTQTHIVSSKSKAKEIQMEALKGLARSVDQMVISGSGRPRAIGAGAGAGAGVGARGVSAGGARGGGGSGARGMSAGGHGGGARGMSAGGRGGGVGAAKCHWDHDCTNAKCAYKHSKAMCGFDTKCTKHPLGTCRFRHTHSG
jgi:hypothetical protein